MLRRRQIYVSEDARFDPSNVLLTVMNAMIQMYVACTWALRLDAYGVRVASSLRHGFKEMDLMSKLQEEIAR